MNQTSSTPSHQQPRTRPHHRLLLGASILLSIVAVVIVAGGVAISVSGETATLPVAAARPSEGGVGLCLAASVPSGTDHTRLVAALESTSTANRHFFPAPLLDSTADTDAAGATLVTAALWPSGASPEEVREWRIDDARSGCPEHTDSWSIRVTHAVLADGADRVLEAAAFSEEWTASMEVELRPAESSVRTVLHFAGPLGISGSCWVDDNLSVDTASGTPVATSEADDDAGLAGLIACRSFADALPDGAAGEQALALVPRIVALDGPSDLRLVTESIVLSTDAIVIEGSFEHVPSTQPTLG